jgi:hypothetical protein
MRDERLIAALGERPVVLWFEHDLYDQLQLLEVLSFVDERLVDSDLLALIVIDRFPGRPAFKGLGELDPEELATLWPQRRPLSAADLAAGRRGWAAFTAPEPSGLEEPARAADGGLPLMPAALRRLLEEYPGTDDGLSRSERQILAGVARGADDPMRVFYACMEAEEAPFAGDRHVWDTMLVMASGPRPLLEIGDRNALERGQGREVAGVQVGVAADGERVLAGAADAVALRGIDRWIGGVHLTGVPDWRWDPRRAELVRGPARRTRL